MLLLDLDRCKQVNDTLGHAAGDRLLQHADVAMHTSERGDGLPETYAADDDNSPRRLAMAGELRNALEVGAIDVHYQPKIRLADGVPIGVEALARWTDRDSAVEVLTRLSELGVGLSIDDFGTGFSSMAYLTRLPAHELKIDRGFVGSMCESASDAVIVRTITELGHNLGLRVVAEGVEDAATRAAVTGMGCEEAQGHLWSPALPAPALCVWVMRNSGGDVPGLRAITPLRAAADR